MRVVLDTNAVVSALLFSGLSSSGWGNQLSARTKEGEVTIAFGKLQKNEHYHPRRFPTRMAQTGHSAESRSPSAQPREQQVAVGVQYYTAMREHQQQIKQALTELEQANRKNKL